MTTPSEYQSYAKECARWAAQAKNEDERIALLEMARAWTHVAWVEHDVARQSLFDGAAWHTGDIKENHRRDGLMQT